MQTDYSEEKHCVIYNSSHKCLKGLGAKKPFLHFDPGQLGSKGPFKFESVFSFLAKISVMRITQDSKVILVFK